MKSIVSNLRIASVTAAPRGHWSAWLISAAALIAAGVPEAGPWAMLLFALAIVHWAWLVYGGGRRGTAGAGERDMGGIHNQALRNLIVESSRTAGNDLRALRTDLKQVRGLVHDAVVTLGDGFQDISGRMQLEGEVIEALKARILGNSSGAGAGERQAPASTRALLQELQQIFQAHIGNLSDIGHCRDEAIHRMDDLVKQIDGAVRQCGTAGQAVNATAAAGPDRLSDQLACARTTVLEVRRMIGEVIVRDLTAALSTKRGIDAMLAEGTELNHYLSEVLSRASSASAGVNDNLGVLVRSLQFEDVVRQLLEYCDRQVAGIEAYIDGLVSLLADPKLGQHPEEQQAKLMHACESYLESSTRWANDRQRHITQTSMQAGNVELF